METKRIKTVSDNCMLFIHMYDYPYKIVHLLDAYLNHNDEWAIGFGTTEYPDGRKVEKGDKIKKKQVFEFLKNDLRFMERKMARMIKSSINQNQFDALVSFANSVDERKLQKTTLIQLVNNNPNDPLIEKEFKKWIFYPNGERSAGFFNRRLFESRLYFGLLTS